MIQHLHFIELLLITFRFDSTKHVFNVPFLLCSQYRSN